MRCLVAGRSQRSWPMVFFEWTSLPSIFTSKAPVTPGSRISVTTTSGNFDSIDALRAVENRPYPHPPQYWIDTDLVIVA